MDTFKSILVTILKIIQDYLVKPKPPAPLPPVPNPIPTPNPLPPTPKPVPTPNEIVIVEPFPYPWNPPTPVPEPLPPIPVPTPIPEPLPPIPVPVPTPVPMPVPGDNVKWMNFPLQRNDSNNSWKPFLTDVHNHLPKECGNQYYGGNLITHCHETTHGINNYISNNFKPDVNLSNTRGYGFYVGNNQAVILSQPKLTISQIAPLIPSNLRGSRYQLYLINQQRDWNNDSFYLFDELVAYTNGAVTGLEVADSFSATNDYMIGPIEFAVYVLFLTIAIKKYDPNYLTTNTQFKEFLAHELKRALKTYKTGIVIPVYQWDTNLENTMKNNQDIKDILNLLYGNSLTLDILLA